MTSISVGPQFIVEIGPFCFVLYTMHTRLTIIAVIAEVKKHVRPTLIPMVTGIDRTEALLGCRAVDGKSNLLHLKYF